MCIKRLLAADGTCAVLEQCFQGRFMRRLCVLASLQQGSRASFDTADLHNSASRDDV
jgi:hypothetical protein